MNIATTKMYATISAPVSAIDGIQYKTMQPQVSAFLGTMLEMLHKLHNRILTASTTLISGGSAGSVALGTSGAGGASGMSGIMGTIQGWPFFITGEALSAQPSGQISTTSTTIRKVLVVLTASALPVASSLAAGGFSLAFVYGSAYTTSAGVVNSGGASAYFNKVPLPKPSANQVPVGWLNVYNSFATSAGIANHMMITDWRETQGINFDLILSAVVQP